MNNARLAQAAGACALMGGSAWTSANIIHAFQPRGCIAEECALRPMREATTGTSWLIAVSALAMIGFLLALLLLVRRSSDLGWTGIAGVTACGFGVAALVLGAVVPQLRDFRWALPGGAALAVGLALLGWTVLRSHVVPTWAGIGLLVGTALLVGIQRADV